MGAMIFVICALLKFLQTKIPERLKINLKAMLNKKQFETLANFHGPECVTVFMPTHRAGQEVNEGQDQILLKKQLKTIARELESRGFNEREIDEYLHAGRELLKETYLWRNLSDGLALFVGKDFFQYYTVPLHFEEFIYISDHFYLRPLIPLFTGDGRFFLLTVTLNGVKFYEGSRDSLTQVYVKNLTPARLEEVVGYDYEQKSLNYRTGQSGDVAGGMFHGHGEGKEDRKDEIKRFLRAVNDGLMEMLHDEDAPMVVACVDYLFPIFREVNNYPYLLNQPVAGNPEHWGVGALHEKSWEVVRPVFEKILEEKKENFNNLLATDRTSYHIEEIVPDAVHGRVDTLFIRDRGDIYGVFDPAENKVEVDEARKLPSASLLNLAAVKTFLQGGKVFLLEAEEMPVPEAIVNALMRY